MAIMADRIKECRRSRGMRVEDIAKKVGISRATFYRYESSEEDRIPAGILDKLAEILGTTKEYLLGVVDDRYGTASSKKEEEKTSLCLPIIGVVRAGAGGITFQETLGEAAVESSCVRGYNKNDFFWSLVKGDSMEPRFYEGDIILVRKQPSVESGTFAVVLVDDEEGVVKKVCYDENSVTLVSLNSKYPPRRFEGREVLRIRVVGAVVRAQSNF